VIEHISAPCGCLDAITKPATEEELSGVAPGESGEIRAVVTPGNHRGLIRKSVYVRFFGHDDHVELIVEARIPSQVELSQQELTWTPAEKDESRVIDVTSGTGQDFNITDLLGVSEQLYTIRRELVTANHYRLHITPAGTLDPGIQILQIRTDSADPRCQLLTVFLRAAESTPSDESVTSGSGATPLKISDKGANGNSIPGSWRCLPWRLSLRLPVCLVSSGRGSGQNRFRKRQHPRILMRPSTSTTLSHPTRCCATSSNGEGTNTSVSSPSTGLMSRRVFSLHPVLNKKRGYSA